MCLELVDQIKKGNQSIVGFMLESHLYEGNQASDKPSNELVYGVSVTDACIGWLQTEQLLHHCVEQLMPVLPSRFNTVKVVGI